MSNNEFRDVEAVLIQKDLESGLTKNELIRMVELLNIEPNDEIDLVIVEGEHCVAQGIISLKASDEKLHFNTVEFGNSIAEILNDINLENDSGLYSIFGVNTLLLYGIE